MKWYLWIAFVSSCTNVFANERIVLAPGGTTLVQCPKVEHVALGNEQVISVKETLPGQLLLSARQPGATVLWCLRGTHQQRFDIVVSGVEEGVPSQYLIDVLVTEVSEQAAQEFGLDIQLNGDIRLQGMGTSRGLNPQFDDAMGVLNLDVFGRLQAAERRGYANLWSQGVLHLEDGETTTLVAGGEIPIPGGESATEFRPYGLDIQLAAKARDLTAVSLDVDLSLTALDYAVQLDGVPGLSSRELQLTRRFALGLPVLLARIERGERGHARQGLPGALAAVQQSTERRELWVVMRPRLADRVEIPQVSVTPMLGSRDPVGVYQ